MAKRTYRATEYSSNELRVTEDTENPNMILILNSEYCGMINYEDIEVLCEMLNKLKESKTL